MNNSVKVTANEAGQVVNISERNPDYAYIRVAQERAVFENGWARRRTLSALISGTTEDLKAFGWGPGMKLPGKIQIIEQLEAFDEKSPERDYKIAGSTGIVCCVDGQPIYRKTFYTEDESAQDELKAHNNTDDIKAKYAELSEKSATEEDAEL